MEYSAVEITPDKEIDFEYYSKEELVTKYPFLKDTLDGFGDLVVEQLVLSNPVTQGALSIRKL